MLPGDGRGMAPGNSQLPRKETPRHDRTPVRFTSYDFGRGAKPRPRQRTRPKAFRGRLPRSLDRLHDGRDGLAHRRRSTRSTPLRDTCSCPYFTKAQGMRQDRHLQASPRAVEAPGEAGSPGLALRDRRLHNQTDVGGDGMSHCQIAFHLPLQGREELGRSRKRHRLARRRDGLP